MNQLNQQNKFYFDFLHSSRIFETTGYKYTKNLNQHRTLLTAFQSTTIGISELELKNAIRPWNRSPCFE